MGATQINLSKKLVVTIAGLLVANGVLRNTALGADDISASSSSGIGAAGGIGIIVCLLLFAVIVIAIYVWIAVWIYRDATKRGAPAALWVILFLLLNIGSPVILVAYLIMRPQEFEAEVFIPEAPPVIETKINDGE